MLEFISEKIEGNKKKWGRGRQNGCASLFLRNLGTGPMFYNAFPVVHCELFAAIFGL